MKPLGRRDFLRVGSLGIAAGGTAGLVLPAYADPTASSGSLDSYAPYAASLKSQQTEPVHPLKGQPPKNWQPTEDNILGPYHRSGAPFRAKITPPLEQGVLLLIHGRVWGLDTRRPLAFAVLDIWQANAAGRYDNDKPEKPPANDVFLNRARLVTDESGYYEFETIIPGPYKIGPRAWRPSHIHYLVQHPGYSKLVTQLYFKGDPHNATDPFIKPSLIIEPEEVRFGDRAYKTGVFDIILAKRDV